MSAHSIAQTIAAEQGWNSNTMLDLALDYIENQGDNPAFEEHLRSIAAEENSASAIEGPAADVLRTLLRTIAPQGGTLSCRLDMSDGAPVMFIEQVDFTGKPESLDQTPDEALGHFEGDVMTLINDMFETDTLPGYTATAPDYDNGKFYDFAF